MAATQNASLFFQGIDAKKGMVVLNKKQIAHAWQAATNEVEVRMISGDVFILNMNATMFGDMLYQLGLIEHRNENLEGA